MSTAVQQDYIELYRGKTARSARLFEEANQVMPGGVTANIKYFDPYPIIMAEADGAWLKDVDGNQYVDYLLGYGALILGHGHHKITTAVMKQLLTKGTALFGTPHELEIELAKKLIRLYPGVEQVRYTNSGTEATLLAIRLAHAYTGKRKVAKFEGHYHGGFDQVLFSINPSINEAGDARSPNAVPESAGVDPYHKKQTVILPFNDLEATRVILKAHQDELAAVIMEPVQGGFIPATKEFMHGLRQVTEELGILLIFDEVKTCFRVSLGGAQAHYGVKPDLTALGKVLGGGFPIGAVGGKREIMAISNPKGKKDVFELTSRSSSQDVLFHSGTYNGHPLALAAGLATIETLEENKQFETIVTLTDELRRGVENVLRYYQIPAQTLGLGSIFNLVLTEEPVINFRDLKHAHLNWRKELDYHLLTLGVYTKPLNRYSLSLAHTPEDIQFTIDAYEAALRRLTANKGVKLPGD